VRAALLAALLTFSASAAAAHPAPFSYLDLRISQDAIDASLVLHVIDVAHELKVEPPDRLLDARVAAQAREIIAGIIASRLTLRADGRDIVPGWTGIEPLPERQAVRLTFRIRVPRPASLAVSARLFPYDPNHQTFLNVYENGSLRQQAIFDQRGGERIYYAGSVQGTLAVVGTFVRSGIHHILIGPDHILFLVGLLLLGGGVGALVKIVTAFTVGHSITLSLAALDVVSPPASIVEPAIALSIVFVGADNLLVGEKGRDVRAWAALAFGLVHGFGFANVLREFGLPREALGWSLFSFNVGVEIGQLMIVAVVAGALAAVRRRSHLIGHRLAMAGSLVVIAAGAYWFVERVFFAGGA
jgi:hypothetical protein